MSTTTPHIARLWALPALLAASWLACSDQQPATECDPLRTGGIALAAVLAAGKHADGTIHVIDKPGPGNGIEDYRVFVSQGRTLVRKQVQGFGIGPGGSSYVFSLDSKPRLDINVEIAGSMVRMSVLRDGIPGKDFMEGDPLEVLPAESLAGMPLRDLPKARVNHLAALEDGRQLITIGTLPTRIDRSLAGLRLFFGPPDRMVERAIYSFFSIDDTRDASITFDLDGERAVAHFPWSESGLAPNLSVGGQKLPFKGSTAGGSNLDGLSFICAR